MIVSFRLFILTVFVFSAFGTLVAQQAEIRLDEQPQYQHGLQALNDGLPELAIERFAALLKTLTKEADKSTVNLLLASSYVKSGNHEAALLHLENVSQSDTPKLFWRAQALALAGRYAAAIKDFKAVLVDEKSDLLTETRFGLSALQALLGQSPDAITTLKPLIESESTGTAKREAALRTSALLLELREDQQALQTLALIQDWKAYLPKTNYLRGQIFLSQKKAEPALLEFERILKKKDNLPDLLVSSAELGMAKSHLVQGDAAKGMAIVSQFISARPDAPQLPIAFQLLSELASQDSQQQRVARDLLDSWLPAFKEKAQTAVLAMNSNAAPALTTTKLTRRETYSLFYRASLAPQDEPGALLALRLLNQLRLSSAESSLVEMSLLETGLRATFLKRNSLARRVFTDLSATTKNQNLKASASFLLASSLFSPANPGLALAPFKIAAEAQVQAISQVAEENAALIMLSLNQTDGVSKRIASLPSGNAKTSLELELALISARKDPKEGLLLLDRFLTQHPDHTRIAEVQLTLAEVLGHGSAQDQKRAQDLLSSLAANTTIDRGAYTLSVMKIAQQQLAFQVAKEAATSFLSSSPGHMAVPAVTLRLGQVQFQQGDFNDARITLQTLASIEDLETPVKEAALYFAALAAWQVGTPASSSESIEILEQVVELKGQLLLSARRDLAESLITFGRYEDALTQLNTLGDEAATGSETWLRAILLKAEVYLKQNTQDRTLAEKVIELYDEALSDKTLSTEQRSHLILLKGRAHEELGNQISALDTYYSLFNREIGTSEIRSFEVSGFRIIALLEREQRWPAAIAVAKKLARAGGPRAKEADDKAKSLSLRHMQFDE